MGCPAGGIASINKGRGWFGELRRLMVSIVRSGKDFERRETT